MPVYNLEVDGNHNYFANGVLVHNCHHYAQNAFGDILRGYPLKIGYTATPERGDGLGLHEVYDRLVVAAHVHELVEDGVLVRAEIERPAKKRRPGTICMRPVDAYLKKARNRRAIVFSPTVAAAEAHAEEFRALGVEARAVSATTSADLRAHHIARFRSGALRVLVNVYVLTEGFDAKECDCVILARDFGTTGTYLQAIGRGLRSAPGKTDCLVLDLHGTSYVHGRPEEERIYSLEGKAIRRSADDLELDPGTSCRVCGAPTIPGEACAECGTEPRSVAVPKISPSPMVKYATLRAEPIEAKIERLAAWIMIARTRKYKPRWVHIRFAVVYGEAPSAAMIASAMKLLQERAA